MEEINETLELSKSCNKAINQVIELTNRINKAIEYIEENSYKYTQISKDLKEKEINDLLDILRGEDE